MTQENSTVKPNLDTAKANVKKNDSFIHSFSQ